MAVFQLAVAARIVATVVAAVVVVIYELKIQHSISEK